MASVKQRVQSKPSSETRLLINRVLQSYGYRFNRDYKYVIGNEKIIVKLTTPEYFNIIDINKNSLAVTNNHSIRR